MGILDKAKQARADALETNAAKQARDESPAQRWEYDAMWMREGLTEGVAGSAALTRKLDEKGLAGWELVQIVNDRAVFKRPL